MIRTCVLALAIGLASCSNSTPESVPEEIPVIQGVFGQAPPTANGITSVVMLDAPTPIQGSLGQGDPTIDQLGLEFTPKQLLVQLGQTVGFTNSESIGHNVHLSVLGTDSTVFNTDTDTSQRVDYVFDEEGAYNVTCDVHPGMQALIYVTDAPFGVFAEENGSFVIPDVPRGTYTLSVWSFNADFRIERIIEVNTPSTEVDLDVR